MSGAASEHETVVQGLKGSAGTAFSFGKYQLFASLGRGGMADVSLAVSRGPMGFNKLVVIKRLRPALAGEAAFRAMFLDEARLAARLNHPNVVHTYEVGDHNGIYFIAMEYLEGQSLNKVMKAAVRSGLEMDPVLAVRIIADALVGLQHAHELRDYDGKPLTIIHRDVSPHNIFATYDGHVKLVDFGIAKAATSSAETEVGVLKGKVAYMAPEQAAGGLIDHRVDLFGMGIVLWEMLALRRLMVGESAANTIHRLMNLPIPRISDVKPDIDPELDAIVARALQKDPDKRYQTALEMRDALEGWITSTGRSSRQDDVGRLISSLFQRTREEVQRQIATHMEMVTIAKSTAELSALTGVALRTLEAGNSAKFLDLDESGGESGIISAYPPPPGTSAPTMQSTSTMSGPSRAPTASLPPPSIPAPGQRVAWRGPWRLMLALLLASFAVIAVLVVRRGSGTPQGFSGNQVPSESAMSAAPEPVAMPEPATSAPLVATGSAPQSPSVLAAVPAPNAPVQRRRPASPNTPLRPVAAPIAVASAAAHTDEAPGFLTLSTYPSTMVSEGGKAMGSTPLVKVPLAAGTHVLTLENAEQGIKQQYSVTIKAGEHLKRSPAFK